MVELRLLGPSGLRSTERNEILSVLAQPKRLALLSYLAVHNGGAFHRREKIVGLLWSQLEEKKARSSLSVAFHHLRRSVGSDVLVTRGDEIGVAPDALWCDVVAFERAVRDDDLLTAADLYRGPLLDGFHLDGASDFTRWFETKRDELQRVAIDVLGRLADEAAARGDGAARVWARRAVELAPYDGASIRRLIELLARSGHRAAAVKVFEDYETRLREDLDLDPAESTYALVDTVKAGEIAAGTRLAPADVAGASTPPVSGAPADPDDGDAGAGAGRPSLAPRREGRALPWSLAAAAAVAAVVLASRPSEQPVPVAPARFAVSMAEELASYRAAGMALRSDRPSRTAWAFAPSGQYLAYENPVVDGPLHLRHMRSGRVMPLSGTEGGYNPFFSPDGAWLAFFDGPSLRRVSVHDGSVETVVPDARLIDGARGATWGDDDRIVYGAPEGLFRVPAVGGQPELVLPVPAASTGTQMSLEGLAYQYPRYYQPHMLPGSELVLYHEAAGRDPSTTAVVALDLHSGRTHRIVEGASDPRYVEGRLFFARRGTVFAAVLDVDALTLRRDAVPVLEDVMHAVLTPSAATETAAAQFAIAAVGGHLAYAPGGVYPANPHRVLRVSAGQAPEPNSSMEERNYGQFRVSPDGERIAFASGPILFPDIWVHDRRTGISGLVYRGGSGPLWSRDGAWLVFASLREEPRAIYRIRADGSGEPERVVPGTQRQYPLSYAPDGTLAYFHAYDIWIAPPDGERRPFVATEASEHSAAFSPDGRWMAYVSDRSGRLEVYARKYPEGEPTVRVSPTGGTNPAWSKDGDRILYLSLRDGPSRERRLYSAEVTIGEGIVVERPTVYVDEFPGAARQPARAYDLLPDGSILTHVPVSTPPIDDRDPPEYVIVLNWLESVRARLDR